MHKKNQDVFLPNSLAIAKINRKKTRKANTLTFRKAGTKNAATDMRKMGTVPQ
jgi:hypothetical protein